MLKTYEKRFALLQRLVDFLGASTCWIFAYWLRFESGYWPAQPGLREVFLQISPIVGLITIWTWQQQGLYRSHRYSSRYKEISIVLKSNAIATSAIVMAIYFFWPERLSRLSILFYFFISNFVMIIIRMSVRNFLRYLRRQGKNLRHVLLVGDGKQMQDYVSTVRLYKDAGIRFIGWLDSNGAAKENDIEDLNGNLEDIRNEKKPDGIIVGYPSKDSIKVDEIVKNGHTHLTPIQVLPDLTFTFIGHQIHDFAGIPLISVNAPSLSSLDLFLKRMMDIIFSFCALLFLLPFFVFISILIKLTSKGPIFYGQERMGHDGSRFIMWKFRTMVVGAQTKEKLGWTVKNDPRVTKIGSILRKTSIDETPQFWNVLIGDMSLVGPRPEQTGFVLKYKDEIPGYMLKHRVKAGLTGWAQVNGWRGDTSLEKRIEHDMYYINNWSLWMDVKILFLTLFTGLTNKNAY